MTGTPNYTKISLLDQEYQFDCPAEETQQLLAAAEHINAWVGDAGLSAAKRDNLLAMVALNMAGQLLNTLDFNQQQQTTVSRINHRIKEALDNQGDDMADHLSLDDIDDQAIFPNNSPTTS